MYIERTAGSMRDIRRFEGNSTYYKVYWAMSVNFVGNVICAPGDGKLPLLSWLQVPCHIREFWMLL